jgi:hypothetical protein
MNEDPLAAIAASLSRIAESLEAMRPRGRPAGRRAG